MTKCNTNLHPLIFVSKCKSVSGFVLVVHGFERPEHEEMKHLAVNRSVFIFPRAQVFQIHAPLALIRLLLLIMPTPTPTPTGSALKLVFPPHHCMGGGHNHTKIPRKHDWCVLSGIQVSLNYQCTDNRV